MTKQQKQRLGKGLSALLGEYAAETPKMTGDGIVEQLPVDRIRPNPFQPRRDAAATNLSELVESIRENGLLQPVVVRSVDDGWEIVAGERRWRAVSELGWGSVPGYVRDVDDQTMLVLALIENLQREDLTPIDEAHAYQRLIDQFGMTQSEVAAQVGRDRSTVANTIRLLSLPESVLKLVVAGELSAGHARSLLGLDSALRATELARQAVSEGWSVRALEAEVRSGKPPSPKKHRSTPANRPPDAHATRAAQALGRALGTEVRVTLTDKARGKIEIPFRDSEDFERIVETIVGVGGIL